MIIVNSYEFDGFEITIVTTTSPQTFVLPIASGGIYGGTINWGDGATTTITAAGNYSKEYATASTYKIKIKGAFHGINFNNAGTSKNLVTRVKISPKTRSLVNSFFGCSNLAIVTGSIPNGVTTISYAWYNNQLTSWTIAIPSSVTGIVSAWQNNQLTSWTIAIPSSVTSIFAAWYNNRLTSWTIAIPSSVTNISNAWAFNLLTSWTIAIPSSVTNVSQAWQNNQLTSWTIAIPSSVTTISYAWALNRLTSWTIAIPNSVTNISYAWAFNQLTSWTIAIPSSVTNVSYAWQNNTTLANFAANIFNGCLCTNFTNAFTNTGLNQQSIDNILVSINSNNTSNGTFNQSGGSAPSATGQAAITAMRSRGWTITVTGGF